MVLYRCFYTFLTHNCCMELNDIPVTQLMSSDLVTASPDMPVDAAGDTLLNHGVGSLLVTDDAGELAGILTSTDFVAMVTDDIAETTVEDLMTESVVTVSADDSIRDAAAKMIAENIQHLPVVDEDGVLGMLSATDLTAQLSYINA